MGTMKVLEVATEYDFIPDTRWVIGNTAHEVYIVLGEDDCFEERYYMTMTLGSLGFSKEEAREIHKVKDLAKEKLKSVDLEKLKGGAVRVLYKDLYPEFDPEKFTRFDEASQTHPDSVFVKEKSLLVADSGDLSKQRNSVRDMITELRACEKLKHFPHPNVTKYLGCRVQNNLVTGIYYERISTKLEDKETPLDIDKYADDVEKGLEHIHSLGYCHNDISPNNIMLRDDDTAAIIDFDGCLPVGEKLGKRPRRFFWRGTGVSDPENDWYSLERVELWMHVRNNLKRLTSSWDRT